jgi:rhodanese-related sulfurtransferase
MSARRTAEELLEEARRGLRRLTPAQAHAAAQRGALIVDTRSEDERRRQGWLVPGALHHPLSTVLWRLDPSAPTSNRKLPLDTEIVVVCREGYSSSLAAAWLRQLGFAQATDVIGGVAAWLEAGLPLEPYRDAPE